MSEQNGIVDQIDTSTDPQFSTENITVIGDKLALEATEDRLILREDRFRTGYECTVCDGDRFSNEPCSYCRGLGTETTRDGEVTCRICEGTKRNKCSHCQGKGGVLIAPEIAQKRPSSGVVTSVGPLVNFDERGNKLPHRNYCIGDRVLYSQFCGSAIEFKGKGTVRIMRVHEVLSRLFGVGELGKLVR